MACTRRFTLKIMFYLFMGTLFNLYNMWSWLMEPHGNMCKHKPLGGNNSGMKALIYGMAKTGTTTMVRSLYDIGFNAYHNEEWNFHVWAPLNDEFWYRPENGGRLWGMHRLATPSAPAYKGHSFWPRFTNGSDLWLMEKISNEEFAAAISKCRVEAMSFDGAEPLFEKVLRVSPDAKVIVLDWRSYKEYWSSFLVFSVFEFLGIFGLNFLVTSMHILPWNAFIFPWLDPLLGGPIEDFMRNGRPFHKGTLNYFNAEHPMVMLWRMQFFERRVCQHIMSGFLSPSYNESMYNDYWAWIKKAVPPERRFHFNMKKHGHRDLCKFFNISGKPICEHKGPIPYRGVSILNHEREKPKPFAMVALYLVFLHFLSYHVFWLIVHKILHWLSPYLPKSRFKVE